ncbi:argininosuccinate lyase [Candidatus Roizmanbacteria bacterium CG10_big_fil_rev_8_21_14_0_10_39_12]|uniref:Argininosuccinate lyase n=2 Tax=Candidatus Roizmaniibacteriota TaxID=1752723 RepID=A0A2M8KQA8_9BACT|nr:MAG: argininosuccinate lyase [Candidatus Roizmanbacteria bacterium CG_4_10_14_0_2_um_filter_39_12]PJE62116.1 MAG: argininosuccinate lyase [Candidatus Roizmanbacteria bacterium CG10_big_fil_rev_8_21_14_0_10_39_12]
MKKLWQKNKKLNEQVEHYCSKNNVEIDNQLITFDVFGSMAHSNMLYSIGVLTLKEYQQIHLELKEILTLKDSGAFRIELGDEDVHTKIEGYLTDKLGDIGKKIHTGRSRNDQINVDLQLYSKSSLFQVAQSCMELILSFLDFVATHEFVPMPGYTHMQKAMPSSVGMWAESFAESFLDDLSILKSAYRINDASPLGSGAGYGIPLPLDRELTAKLLGFKKVQNNSLYAQVSRCKIQYLILHSLAQCMLTLSRFAEDMLLFTTSEFNFFVIPEELQTGSSIMPQKKNLDAMEVLRANTYKVLHHENVTASILTGLPSGYNSDFAETKESLFASFSITNDSLNIVKLLIDSIQPNKESLQQAHSPELYATHQTYELVQKGVPFRKAYGQIGSKLGSLRLPDIKKVLTLSTHVGGTGNLNVPFICKQAIKQAAWWKIQKQNYTDSIKKLKYAIISP